MKNNQGEIFDPVKHDRQFVDNLLADPEIKAEYERLQPEFAVISQLIEAKAKGRKATFHSSTAEQ